nr:hypothetical protein [Tanacetum cinerariifolium]
ISRSIDYGSRFTKRTSFYGSFGIRFFSLWKGIIDTKNKTNIGIFEDVICLKDHLDAQERIQHISNLEGDCLDIKEQLLEVEAEVGYAINLADEEINLEEQAMSGSGDSE